MALSPMMQHYLEIKDKYKDCIVFYRLGDFYEMFFDDALEASKLLDLTLTGRDCGLKERAPMCGVPYHAVDQYISKLVSFGKKVAICEQLENAADVKGIVKRDVVRVITAGTVTDGELLDERTSNFICCAYKDKDCVALAWADITTGEMFATEFFGADCVKHSTTHMQKISVKEVICNDEMLLSCKDEPLIKRRVLPHFSSYFTNSFNKTAAERRLLEQFKVQSLSAYSIYGKTNAICACGALIDYLQDTQKHSLKNIDSVNYISNNGCLQLDSVAIKNLELNKSLADGKEYGSLLWLLRKTKTGMGARLLSNEIVAPFVKKEDINYRLDGVEELYNSTVVRLGIIDSLKEISDISRLTGRISNDNIVPQDCLSLAKSILEIPKIKFKLAGFSSKIIKDICSGLHDLTPLAELLVSAISERAPNNLKDGGYIKEGYSKQLDELRNIKQNAGKMIIDMEARERDATGIRTLRISYNRVFGYYLEVSQSFKDKVPINYQRKQTLANSERYITEELKNLEEKILGSQEAAINLEYKLFEYIKSVLSENVGKLKEISAAIALLDVISCFAEIAKNNRYVRPQIVDSDKPLEIVEGRHPVVEVISKDRFVPNDTLLDEKDNRTLILTGPNMAGKSTYMRQTAIISIMAHLGCFVPAKSAKIPIIDRIFTRVGASDNLISDQSTFMVEMIEVATILQNATKNSLLILDEVGRGTSTYDGLSIAWAVIEYLTEKIGAKTLFATHYHELTELESKMEGVKNYKITVREINGGIVFLRKIVRGGANRSFGIEVASLAGVPSEVTDRAKAILKLIENGDKKFDIDSKNSDDEEEVKLSEVEKIISEVNMDNISPMQAFILLGDLVEKVKNEN